MDLTSKKISKALAKSKSTYWNLFLATHGCADIKTLQIIHKALILSQINYDSSTYIIAKENLLKILDSIHNEGIRISIWTSIISSINSILCYTEELFLKLLGGKYILNYCIKRKSTPNHQQSLLEWKIEWNHSISLFILKRIKKTTKMAHSPIF